jgi:hypothetical protein
VIWYFSGPVTKPEKALILITVGVTYGKNDLKKQA